MRQRHCCFIQQVNFIFHPSFLIGRAKLQAETLETAAGQKRESKNDVLEPRQRLSENNEQQYFREYESAQANYHILLCRTVNGTDRGGDVSYNHEVSTIFRHGHSLQKQRLYLQVSIAPRHQDALLEALQIRIIRCNFIQNSNVHFPAVCSNRDIPICNFYLAAFEQIAFFAHQQC